MRRYSLGSSLAACVCVAAQHSPESGGRAQQTPGLLARGCCLAFGLSPACSQAGCGVWRATYLRRGPGEAPAGPSELHSQGCPAPRPSRKVVLDRVLLGTTGGMGVNLCKPKQGRGGGHMGLGWGH